jgi:hypothetical protein
MPNQTADPNSTALDAVDKLISGLDPIIQRYDDLNQQKAELETLLVESQQLEKQTLADESLSHDVATERLVSSRARNDVLKVRLQSISQKISDQLKAVIAAGQLAQAGAYALWAQLRRHRIQRSHEIFQANFKLPGGAPVSINNMMEDSTLPQELLPLRTPFEFDRTHPVEFNLDRIRRLRQAFAELRPVVEAEPGLVLQSPASAPELTVVSAAA